MKPWLPKSSEIVLKHFGRAVKKVEFQMPDGSNSDFYIREEPVAVAVLALTKDQKFILVRQFRPGPMRILDELPGGYVGAAEDPIEAASRELLEESGYSGKIEFVTSCYDDAYSSMRRHCFVATNCEKVTEPSRENTKEEVPEIILATKDELLQNMRSGLMTDVEVAFLGLDFLKKL